MGRGPSGLVAWWPGKSVPDRPWPSLAVPDLRSLSRGRQASGTDVAETAWCAPANGDSPVAWGGIPFRFPSMCCASPRLTRSQGGHEA